MNKLITLMFGLSICLDVMSVEGKSKLPEFFKRTNTEIKNPMGLRDPFKRRVQKLSSGSNRSQIGNRTQFSNMLTLENVPLDKIKILGVILGDNRRAIARTIKDEERLENPQPQFPQPGDVPRPVEIEKFPTYVITEGMKLGINNAEVRAILPGGVVLVEKIRNVYDQEEYIETIIPVSVD